MTVGMVKRKIGTMPSDDSYSLMRSMPQITEVGQSGPPHMMLALPAHGFYEWILHLAHDAHRN